MINKTIPIEKLIAHPANPNVMSKENFKKLIGHIEKSGNYEPVIVRKHPENANQYQMLNGHHRVKALSHLGYKQVRCVIWNVDDKDALVLLNSLNRLTGKDLLDKKASLIKELTKNFDAKSLAKQLPLTSVAIERLAGITKPKLNADIKAKAFLNCQSFFLDGHQNEIVIMALDNIIDKKDKRTGAVKRAEALVKIFESFLMIGENEK
jgi:ParB/RepB/Spo0J family partition protein